MGRATTGLWPLLLLVCVAASSAGQSPPASADDAQKLEAAWAFLRARNSRDYAVATPNGIDEARYVEVGGIQQWITIRGEDASRGPVGRLPGPGLAAATCPNQLTPSRVGQSTGRPGRDARIEAQPS